ncbi:MAG TPA: hypothetical protein VM681_00945, partial [Candidatus Thermoplasmatota archaeon]|nr:hypothetical protein [Candidatus Thermoplasmatota archaeon]
VLFPAITLAENNADVVLRALPFYGSLAAFVLVLSRGETWERWIALAFLSRAFYFGVSGPHRLPFALSGAALPWEIPNSIALIALLLVTLYASYRLLSDERQPTSSIVLPVLGVAPLVAAAEIAMASQPVGNVMALNLVTLAAVRPLLVCMAFSPARLPALLGRSLVAAGVTTSVFFLLSANGIRNGPDIVLGLAAGLMSLAVLEVWHPGIGQTRHTDFGAPAQPDPSSPGPGSAGARPSWQRILLELRGSSVPPDERPLGDPRFRQKPVADRAKVSVQRVSEFPERMNDSAAQRLDVFVPGWRARHLAGPPVLVQTFKGAVEGLPGTWIYYRLTPLGEQLAAAVAEKPADEAAPETRLF